MNQLTIGFGELDYLSDQSRAARLARACFKAAVFLRLIQPVLVFISAAILVALSCGLSRRCANRRTDHQRW